MTSTARRDLSAWRNDDVYEHQVNVRGLDLRPLALAMQLRAEPDTPGPPLIDLVKVTNGNAEGLRVAGVTTVDGVIVSDLRIRINKSSLQGAGYEGEVGDARVLAYALLIAGRTRLTGSFSILAHAYGSDAAPLSRPQSWGGSTTLGAAPSGGTILTIAGDDVTVLAIDGLDIVQPAVDLAVAASADAVAAARSLVIETEGVYNLVDPAARPYPGQGVNAGGNLVFEPAYTSIVIPVDEGDTLVLYNTDEIYTSARRAAFFSARPVSQATYVGAFAGNAATTADGHVYQVGKVPAGARFLVVNVVFVGTPINWFVARDSRFTSVVPYQPAGVSQLGGFGLIDRAVRRWLSVVEGDDNLYNQDANLLRYYITQAAELDPAGAVDWRLAVIPVEEGQTYAVRTGSAAFTFPWAGLYGAPGGAASGAIKGARVALQDTLDPLVKTFTVPRGQGIGTAFFNVRTGANDFTGSLIVRLGSTAPIAPLPYQPAIAQVNGQPIKDRAARRALARLGRISRGADRFVGKAVLAVGDSRLYGSQYGSWLPYAQDILQCFAINGGSSGARASRAVGIMTNQPRRDGGNDPLPLSDPDYAGIMAVLIALGTNDSADAGGSTVTGSLADIPATSIYDALAAGRTADQYWQSFPDTFYGNTGMCIEYALWKNPELLIYLVTSPHIAGQPGRMAAVDKAYREIAKLYSIRHIPGADECGITLKNAAQYLYDGTHLTDRGNRIFGRYVGHRIYNS